MNHAILGCGRVAPNHADGFAQQPGWNLRWTCDLDADRALELARRYGAERSTVEAAEVLADPQVDLVSICTGHADHAPLAAAALVAGKHVLVEKPLALDVAEAVHLGELARRSERVLAVVSQHRYDPLVRRIRSWLLDGLLGEVVAFSVRLQCRRKEEYYRSSLWRGRWATEGGSVLINQGYHFVDLLRWLAGPCQQVAARASTCSLAGVIETEDTLAAVARLRGGAVASLCFTTAGVAEWWSRVDLVGTQGSVSFDLDHPNTLHDWGGSPVLGRAVRRWLEDRDTEQAPPPPGLDYYGISHRRQIEEVARAVEGAGRVTVDAAEAAATLATIASLYAAAGCPWTADGLVPRIADAAGKAAGGPSVARRAGGLP